MKLNGLYFMTTFEQYSIWIYIYMRTPLFYVQTNVVGNVWQVFHGRITQAIHDSVSNSSSQTIIEIKQPI